MKQINFPYARYFHFIKCYLKKTIHIIFMMIILMDGNSFAKIITVDDDGPADFTTIQSAIDSASNGDTIYVKAGIYRETLIIELEKSISIIGAGAESTFLLAQKSNYGDAAVYILADSVIIKGFTITGEENQQHDGIFFSVKNGIEITDNKLINLKNGLIIMSSTFWGIPYSVKIYGNIITNNKVGVYLYPAIPIGELPKDITTYDAIENWWGTVDTVEIRNGIHDSPTGKVNYANWLLEKIDTPNGGKNNGIHQNNIYANSEWNIYVRNDPTDINDESIISSKSFILYQNYPNPFNPVTTIRFKIQVPGLISLKVYDVLGGEIATLIDEWKTHGTYQIVWNAITDPSGVYFYRLKAKNFTHTSKMILQK